MDAGERGHRRAARLLAEAREGRRAWAAEQAAMNATKVGGDGMAKGSKLGTMKLRGIEAMSAATGAETPATPAKATRGPGNRRGPLPDPERVDLMPVLYRVKPQHHDALTEAADRRASERWDEEKKAAKREGRAPRPVVKRKDASEVLRDLLDAWIDKGAK